MKTLASNVLEIRHTACGCLGHLRTDESFSLLSVDNLVTMLKHEVNM